MRLFLDLLKREKCFFFCYTPESNYSAIEMEIEIPNAVNVKHLLLIICSLVCTLTRLMFFSLSLCLWERSGMDAVDNSNNDDNDDKWLHCTYSVCAITFPSCSPRRLAHLILLSYKLPPSSFHWNRRKKRRRNKNLTPNSCQISRSVLFPFRSLNVFVHVFKTSYPLSFFFLAYFKSLLFWKIEKKKEKKGYMQLHNSYCACNIVSSETSNY